MSCRDSRSSSRALALAALLTLSTLPAHALPLEGSFRLRDDKGTFTAIFETLRSAWLSVWGEEGITIDPHGRPDGSGMTNVLGNEGMSIDPSGRPTGSGGGTVPTPGERTDEGMLIDPHG